MELSIVLVILGLLTGGILAGQSLIRASELRAVSTEYSRYITAAQTFRDKYFAIPGDFRDATKFWGRLNGNADCVTNSSPAAAVGTPGACDGNGGGTIDDAGAANASGENFQFWRHLALAGLVEGSYTGLAGTGGYADCSLGGNIPRSKLSNAGWWDRGTVYNGTFAGDTTRYQGSDYGNTLEFGGVLANNGTMAAALKPEEAWNIDTKMDDGKPGTGKIVPRYWGVCDTATAKNDYAGDYALSNSTPACTLYFKRAF